MSPRLHPVLLFSFACLLFIGCSSKEKPNIQNADIQENFEDVDDGLDIEEDIEEELEPSLQNVGFTVLDGMIHFTWDLPDDNTFTDIRITASPAELMWGEAERHIEPTATEYLFDKLVNDIQYTFKIQTFSDDKETGQAFIFDATPRTRPLLGIGGNSPAVVIDSVTKKPALGWESLTEQRGSVASWSPDGTKLFIYLALEQRCLLFDRATKTEIQLESSEELNKCIPVDDSWSPDGRQLAFARYHEDYRPGTALIVNYSILNTETGKIESDWPSLSKDAPPNSIYSLDWSPDGKRLAISLRHDATSTNLTIIDTQTREIESGWPEYPVLDIGNFFTYLRWSPDSKRLAITHSYNSYTYPIIVNAGYIILNAETKEIEEDWPQIITHEAGYAVQDLPKLTWSPDGELLALYFRISQAETHFQVIDTTTRENQPGWPTDWSRIEDMAWSHDSQFLAISSTQSPYLVIFDRNSKQPDYRWTPLSQPAGRLSWSPHHDPPAAPTDIELIRANDSATLSWNPPDNRGILDYRITIEPANQVNGPADYLLFDSGATEHLIRGLNPEVDYTFSIRAITVFGVGEPAIRSTLE